MKVVFRADASLQIGSGHVMRCLTLADALKAGGAECHFICREHSGHLLELIRSKGYSAYGLINTQAVVDLVDVEAGQPVHAHWLGSTQLQDAEASIAILETIKPDWMIVDHYALDASWEALIREHSSRLLVIDDLADRNHLCSLLLDQNLGHSKQDYVGRVPDSCRLLIGAQYALLRPEFARLRSISLERRQEPQLAHILITMGGVDQQNASGAVLRALKSCVLPADCTVSVVMGLTAPWIGDVKEIAKGMPWPTEVLQNVADMGARMVAADLVIGAAGGSAWERCCLGVPTIVVILADNQISGAGALADSGSALVLGQVSDISERLQPAIDSLRCANNLRAMSESARKVSDGLGVQRVIRCMGDKDE